MFRSRENLHSIYVLLFLHIAFFFMQLQGATRYAMTFAFERNLVFSGQVWRLFTYQFLNGSFFGSPAVGLFFTLLILYIMGDPIEEEFGTAAFVTLFVVSTLATLVVPFVFGFPLLGSFFLGYTLLFIYAHRYPDQTWLLMLILPVKVKWIAYFALAVLGLGIFGILGSGGESLAAAIGAGVGFAFYRIFMDGVVRPFRRRPPLPVATRSEERPAADPGGQRNLERFTEIKAVASGGSDQEREDLIARLEPGVVPGVNICPPPDYKPEAPDLYCVRCEGFNECSIRYLRLAAENRAEKEKAAESEST